MHRDYYTKMDAPKRTNTNIQKIKTTMDPQRNTTKVQKNTLKSTRYVDSV